jgi:hypothetical protein
MQLWLKRNGCKCTSTIELYLNQALDRLFDMAQMVIAKSKRSCLKVLAKGCMDLTLIHFKWRLNNPLIMMQDSYHLGKKLKKTLFFPSWCGFWRQYCKAIIYFLLYIYIRKKNIECLKKISQTKRDTKNMTSKTCW